MVGAWFTFPIDFEEVKEKIGLNDEYEEYAIHDYELPLRLTNTLPLANSIDYGNGIGITRRITIGAICSAHSFSSIEELSEHQEDIIIHSDCDDMYDVASLLH